MYFFPLALLFALALLFLAVAAFFLVQIGLFGAAFERVGLGAGAVPLLLMATLLGSGINIPLRRLRTPCCPPQLDLLRMGFRFRVSPEARTSETVLAVNVGGAVIPALLSVYLLGRADAPFTYVLATALVTWLVHRVARPVPGFGIAVPLLVPAVAAAVAALVLVPAPERAPAAYVAGTLGCLLGADLLNLRRVATLGAPVASIGGAGTFDGIFLSGVIAVFLA